MGSDYRHAITVDGLIPFRDSLREVNDKLPRELQKANKQVAEFVVDRATEAAGAESKQAARAAAGLRASAGQQSATVRLDGDRVPGALGSEFGAAHDFPRFTRRGVVAGWNQFPIWRGNGLTAGIWLYPTIRDTHDEQLDLYDQLIDDLTAIAFPH